MPQTRFLLPLFAAAVLAQQPDAPVSVRHVIGMENIGHNATGKLMIQTGVLQFDGQGGAKIPTSSIDNVFIGAETTQAGGKAGTAAKTAAIAAPYESGAALSLLLRTKVDILTLTYRDGSNGRHAAIFALPKGQGEAIQTRLVAAGAHVNPEEKAPAGPPSSATATKTAPRKLALGPSLPSIMIEPVGLGDTQIPAEFRLAIYERLVERVTEAGKFQRVFRSGDRTADTFPNLITLHTTIQSFKEGSQLKRELTKVLGSTKVDVSATLTDRAGKTLLERDVEGKVRFFGENLGVTNDIAKRIAKALRQSF